jgi:hypothetical protein
MQQQMLPTNLQMEGDAMLNEGEFLSTRSRIKEQRQSIAATESGSSS